MAQARLFKTKLKLSIDDITRIVVPWIDNEFSGFSECIKGCVDKKRFLKVCLQQCNKGWTDNLNVSNTEEPLINFINETMKYCLTRDVGTLFSGKKLTDQDKQLVELFSKIILLNKLYRYCKEDPSVLDRDMVAGIRNATLNLRDQHAKLPHDIQLEFVMSASVMHQVEQITNVTADVYRDEYESKKMIVMAVLNMLLPAIAVGLYIAEVDYRFQFAVTTVAIIRGLFFCNKAESMRHQKDQQLQRIQESNNNVNQLIICNRNFVMNELMISDEELQQLTGLLPQAGTPPSTGPHK